MKERRRAKRAKYPCTTLISFAGKKEKISLTTENVSSGGMRVFLRKEQEINTPLEIELQIGEKVVATKGRVVWVLETSLPSSAQAVFDTGIEFTTLGPQDREFLSKLIEGVAEA